MTFLTNDFTSQFNADWTSKLVIAWTGLRQFMN
jgi:hypothetical protein